MTSTDPFTLIVNPRAAAGRAMRWLPEVEAALAAAGGSFVTRITRSPRDATRLVREALDAGHAGVAVVGGDGTLSEAANGFFDESGEPSGGDAWLAPLPCGTGGDFSRTLGTRGDPVAAARALLSRSPRAIDCGYIRYRDHDGREAGQAFLNIASFGVAGLVDRLVNAGPKWLGGTPAFLLGTARALTRYRPQRVQFSVDDGTPREATITNIAIANGRYFGGGMHVAPSAKIDDGLFDVVTIEAMPMKTQARMLRHLYDGTILGRRGIRHERGTRIVAEPVDARDTILLDVDGEAPGRLPATFTLHRGALWLRA